MNMYIYPIIGAPKNENYGRSMTRVHDIMTILHSKYSPAIALDGDTPLHFVDIGCSMGEITKELARELQTPYGVGVDVLHPSQVPHKQHTDGTSAFQYIQIDPNTNALPFATASQDIVLAVMSLHHIQCVDACIREIVRILKPGGVFLIQEHSPNNADGCVALDILHGMYSMVWGTLDNQEQPFFCEVYDASYKTKWEWMKLLQKYGFEIHVPKMNFKSIPKNNPFDNFWAIALRGSA
jgi:ubiquinone/menaquinone biosynthesis C-methylase UbiE